MKMSMNKGGVIPIAAGAGAGFLAGYLTTDSLNADGTKNNTRNYMMIAAGAAAVLFIGQKNPMIMAAGIALLAVGAANINTDSGTNSMSAPSIVNRRALENLRRGRQLVHRDGMSRPGGVHSGMSRPGGVHSGMSGPRDGYGRGRVAAF